MDYIRGSITKLALTPTIGATMTDAARRLSDIPHEAQVITLARYYAKQGIKAELRAQGRRVQDFDNAELVALARVYLDQHRPELIAKAETVLTKIETAAQQRKA
jgi:hypothetical protein